MPGKFGIPAKQHRITPVETLIAQRYLANTAQPLPDAGGGQPAFACQDQRDPHAALMALLVQPGLPPRADTLETLIGQDATHLLLPLAHGPGAAPGGSQAGGSGARQDGYYVICPAPSAPPLSTELRPWSEGDLLDNVLRPAALALSTLAAKGMTHRAIRLNNLFRPRAGTPIKLGAAWAAPPASLQPALYEPPYVGICLPTGRGAGSIADDVYALGVVLICLALGRLPMARLDPMEIIRRKLDLGSFQAMTGDERLPPIIADLARGMLAEDPEHRPPPQLLTDPVAARARRVAARPPKRSSRPLEIGAETGFNARGVALAMFRDPPAAIAALRTGKVEYWLRRGLGDATLAGQVEEVIRLRASQKDSDSLADAALLNRGIALLDPFAPLCWRGMALWPDGIGPALAGSQGEPTVTNQITEMINAEIMGIWAVARGDQGDEAYMRREARRLRGILTGTTGQSSLADGLMRLRYQLNPLLPCTSPLVAGHYVARLRDLLPALETTAPRADPGRADPGRPDPGRDAPCDTDIAAFINARTRQREERHESAQFAAARPEEQARIQLWLYASLQTQLHKDLALPGMARWLAARAGPLIESWANRPQREALQRQLTELAQGGQLLPLLAILEDHDSRAGDQRGAADAVVQAQRVDAELLALAQNGPARAELARRIGQELAAGAGLAGLAGALAILAFG